MLWSYGCHRLKLCSSWVLAEQLWRPRPSSSFSGYSPPASIALGAVELSVPGGWAVRGVQAYTKYTAVSALWEANVRWCDMSLAQGLPSPARHPGAVQVGHSSAPQCPHSGRAGMLLEACCLPTCTPCAAVCPELGGGSLCSPKLRRLAKRSSSWKDSQWVLQSSGSTTWQSAGWSFWKEPVVLIHN